jgi:hypothetical protein
MDINVLRSKSRDMVLKELIISLTAYNLVRKIIAKSADKVGFSPQKDIFPKLNSSGSTIFLDTRTSYVVQVRGGAFSSKSLQEDMDELMEKISKHLIPHTKRKKRHFPRKTKRGKYQKYK